MKMFKTLTLATAFGLSAASVLAEDFVRGVVVEITTEPERLTIEHGPIPNLDMDGMTMVFRVADPAFLEDLSVGQEIEFEAERIKGRITVTSLREPSS